MDMKYKKMTDKKETKLHSEWEILGLYKEYTEIDDMNVMEVLNPESLK